MAEYPYIEDDIKRREASHGTGNTIGILGGIAAAAGISIVAPGMTQRTMAGASRFGSRALEESGNAISYMAKRYGNQTKQAGSFVQALNHSLDGQSPFRLIFGDQSRINKRFTESYENSMNEMNRRSSTFMGGKPSQLEQDFFDRRNNAASTVPNMHFKAVQYEAVTRQLKKALPKRLHGGLDDILSPKGLDTILAQQRDELFSDPNVPRIEALLDRYGAEQVKKTGKQYSMNFTDDKDRATFVNTMMDTLNAYKDRKSVGMGDRKVLRNGGELDNGLHIQGLRDVHKTLMNDFIDSHQVDPDSVINKTMAKVGLRPLQLKDMLSQDKNGRWVNKLFDNDSIKRFSRKDASASDAKMGNKLAGQVNAAVSRGEDPNKWLNLAVDSRMFINKKGNVTDLRGMEEGGYKSLSFIREQFQVPFLRFNPLDLMHFSTYQSIREAPKTYFFRRGTIHPWLGKDVQTTAHPMAHNQDAVSGPLARDYMFSNNKVYDLVTGDVVKDNMFLASARFGMIPRMAASMGNLHRRDLRDRGVLAKLFDLGGQETQHIWNRGASVFTKFGDSNWERNTFSKLFSEGRENPEFREQAYKNLYAHLNQHTTGFSDRTIEAINPLVKEAYGKHNIDLTRLNTPEEVMEALGKIAIGVNKPNGGMAKAENGGLDSLITNAWNQFQNNPTEFLKNQRIASNESPFVIGSWQAVDPYETTLVSKLDDIKRMIHQHSINQVDFEYGLGTLNKKVNQGVRSGSLDGKSADELRGMNVLNKMQSYWDDVYRNGESHKESALYQFTADVINSAPDQGFANSLYTEIKRNSNVLSAGPGDVPPQPFGLVGHTAMEKGRGYKWAMQKYNERIAKGDGEFRAFGESLTGVLGQPFAGRKNMDQVTAGTMPFYYFAERLDNALGKIGIGLSQENRGSMQSILWNQFGRRVVLPYVAFQQLSYADDQFNNGPSGLLADGYVKGHLGMASVKETLGINALNKQIAELMPGVDQIGKIPIFAGLKHASFGLIGDNRSPEELEKYYESGEEAIRKGRWWGVGSNTPWEGGKIDYYAPNWYRRLKSNYKYTETMYGSSDEYWANNWMPTLTNPFAPIKHFITDADHWEKKHYDDRPYPVQGGIAEIQAIPLVGPILDNTVGRIVKPRTVRGDLEKHHRAYLEDMNNYIAGQYEANTQSGVLNVMPSGGWNLQAGEITGMGPGYVGEGFGTGSWGGIGYEGEDLSLSDIGGAVDASLIGTGATGPVTNVKGVSRSELAMINMNILNGQRGRAITSLDSLRDPDIVANLDSVANPYGVGNTAGGLFYNLTEMAGIYGFSFRMLSGQTDEDLGFALDQSTRMSSYARSYWDQNLGSMDGIFGGEFSEIFRRYLPRDPRKQYYNPIRNTMPEWMPGVDYFTDFQHGDPYVKIAKGEMRLPGAAYETLNRLHPDQYGEYGAFDRFKILADVAPYSNEYGFWKRQVSFMNSSGMLSPEMAEEAKEIREQVSSRKDKYHYYPYQYKNAKIDQETVTVTRVLDAETFLTKEHPNNPIKLAGIQIPSDAVNAQEWLYKYIHEGAKLKIGVDADPLFRVRDDSMNTIRAVVYSSGGEGPFYTDQKGQSLNSILVGQDFGDEKRVTKAPDNSAVGTAAFHDKADITVGKMWEGVVHNLSNIPIVGTIADKFVQVKSPLELYKKNELYGKSWRPWYEPWKGWMEPMIENAASQNPLMAAAQGAGVGFLFGRAGIGKRWGTFIGASVVGGAAATRAIDEALGRTTSGENYAWIPERRRKEREVNEYFDILKYMKFKGLYERASQLAKSKEGIDLDAVLGDSELRGESNKRERDQLSSMKKWLSIQKKLGYYDDETLNVQINKARDRLGQIAGDKGQFALGPYAMQAMQYRAEYESTLQGADPHGDVTQIYRALPGKDKQFFTQFMTASPEEREEILRLVPKDQRRFYQAKWGMEVDEPTNLNAFFLNHKLPGANWEGWRPDVSLESIKVKVARQEGVELTELGMWDDHVNRAEQSGVETINPFRASMSIDPFRIEKVLQGAGLSNVSVTMQVAPSSGDNQLQIAMDVMKDRSSELLSELNYHMGGLL